MPGSGRCRSRTDFKRADGAPAASPPRHALAVGTVRFVGEAVAAIIAQSVEQARDAAEAIDVRYEPLPMVTDAAAAVAKGAPLVWPAASGNIAAEIRHGSAAAAAAAFGKAAHVVALDLVNQRVAACPIEPRAVLASYDAASDRITLRVSCQTPTGLRDDLCNEVLGIPPEKVRVQVGDVGGGFGMKTGIYPEDVVLAFCARALQRPLKWRAERIEEFLAATHGRDVTSRAELALDASRAHPRAARCLAGQPRGVRDARGRGHPADDRAVGVDQHLRHRRSRHPHPGRAHAHRADERLPRRGPARGHLHHRAADGRGRAQIGARIRASCAGAT